MLLVVLCVPAINSSMLNLAATVGITKREANVMAVKQPDEMPSKSTP